MSSSLYPPEWRRCPCGEPVLDGHVTCGDAMCNESATRRMAEAMDRVRRGETNPGRPNRPGCRFPHCACNAPWKKCDR